MTEKLIYISEPLTGRSDIEEIKVFCRKVAGVCVGLGLKPYLPFEATDPIANPDVTPAQVFETDKRLTQAAAGAVFVIPQGSPQSLGVGMEMVFATTARVPAIVVIDQSEQLDGFVEGMIQENEDLKLWHRVFMRGLNDGRIIESIESMLRRM